MCILDYQSRPYFVRASAKKLMSNFLKFFNRSKPLPPVAVRQQATRIVESGMTNGIDLGAGVRWNPEQLPNAHIAAIGASGSGKTQTLKGIAFALAKEYSETKIVVVDFHGDQDISGETVFEFHRESPHGVNLLSVNLDTEGGGVSLQIIAVVGSIKRLLLGANQAGVLLEAIKQAYSRRGIFDEQSETWKLEPPTFADVREVLEQSESKEAAKLLLKLAAFFEYGIFSRRQPDFLASKITRLDLSRLPPSLQAVAAESIAAQTMNNHRLQGEMSGKLPRTFLFVDEAKELKGSPSADRIIADGRKYGLALVLASQSERHLSPDIIGNAATKIVLPVDQTEVRAVARKFRFDENKIAALKPLNALCRFAASQPVPVEILPYYKRR